jgi:hypothetical protein
MIGSRNLERDDRSFPLSMTTYGCQQAGICEHPRPWDQNCDFRKIAGGK